MTYLRHGETHSNRMNHSLHCVEDHRLVQHDLLKAEEVGKTLMQEFIAEQIESNAKFVYAPIQKNKL